MTCHACREGGGATQSNNPSSASVPRRQCESFRARGRDQPILFGHCAQRRSREPDWAIGGRSAPLVQDAAAARFDGCSAAPSNCNRKHPVTALARAGRWTIRCCQTGRRLLCGPIRQGRARAAAQPDTWTCIASLMPVGKATACSWLSRFLRENQSPPCPSAALTASDRLNLVCSTMSSTSCSRVMWAI
jgi:hypothetical protein